MQENTEGITSEAKFTQRFDRAFLPLLGLPLILFILLPLAALLMKVPYQDIFKSIQDQQVRQAIHPSLVPPLLSVGVPILLGTQVSYLNGHQSAEEGVPQAELDGLAYLLVLDG